MSEVASFKALGDVAGLLVKSLKIEMDKKSNVKRQQSKNNR
jgi:hypothetical protein